MPPMPRRATVLGTLLALTLIWGSTWAAIRVSLRGIPPLTGVALRFTLAGLVLLALAPALGVRLRAGRREWALWIANALLTFCVSYGLVFWAEQWVPSGLAAVLFATFPLWVALLAHFMLPDERLGAAGLAGTVLGFVGVAVIFSEDFNAFGGRQVAGVAAVMLLAPLASAIANVAIKRWGRDLHPLSVSAVPMLLAGGVMGALAAVAERGMPIELSGAPLAALVYLALVGSALAFTLYFWLLQHLPATRLSLITYTSPVVAVALGALALGEPVTARMLAGTALVIAGVVMAGRMGKPAERQVRDAQPLHPERER